MPDLRTKPGVLTDDEWMLIDGELQYTGSGAKFDVIHPATEEVVGQALETEMIGMPD